MCLCVCVCACVCTCVHVCEHVCEIALCVHLNMVALCGLLVSTCACVYTAQCEWWWCSHVTKTRAPHCTTAESDFLLFLSTYRTLALRDVCTGPFLLSTARLPTLVCMVCVGGGGMGVHLYIYCMFTHAFCGWVWVYFHNVNICALS